MRFSLCMAPSTFQRVVNNVLCNHLEIFVWVYIHNILIFRKSAEENEQDPELVHELLQQHQMSPCIDKLKFFQQRVPFCRYIIVRDAVHMDPNKIKVI